MALPRRNGRSRATLLFLILLSITVLTLDFRGDGSDVINRVRRTATDAVAPLRDAADTVLSPIGNAFSGITDYDNLKDENAKLKTRIADLQGQRESNENATNELRELLALDRLDWVGNAKQVVARVTSAPVSNFEQTIELDRGTSDGVKVDMPVVTGAGVIGRVVDVSGRRAVVRLITDPASAIGVRFARTGAAGIAAGQGEGKSLSIGFVDTNADVTAGDLAVTSGLTGGSDIYPPSIPVGRVVRAEKVTGDLQQRVEVEPLADIAHPRYVKVIEVLPK